ncbi:MAG: zinc finger Ran-binding domain-containing protein [Anaerolineae bacterium]
MIICIHCTALNEPSREACSQCGAELLPGEGVITRLVYIGLGLFVAAALVVTALLLFAYAPANPNTRWAAPILIAVGAVFMGLSVYASLYKTPLWQRYAARARRHVDLDTEQALADYTQALRLAPAQEKAVLLEAHQQVADKVGDAEAVLADLRELKKIYAVYASKSDAKTRAELALKQVSVFEKLEKALHLVHDEDGALQEHLEYLDWIEQHIEDIISSSRDQIDLASFVTGASTRDQQLVRDFQPRYLLVSQVKDDRARLMQNETIAAVGYCSRCQQVYRLKKNTVCPINPTHGQLTLVEYVLPHAVASAEYDLRARVAQRNEQAKGIAAA